MHKSCILLVTLLLLTSGRSVLQNSLTWWICLTSGDCALNFWCFGASSLYMRLSWLEMLKALDKVRVIWLTYLFSVERTSGAVPLDCQPVMVVVVFKKGTKGYTPIIVNS